MPYWINDTLTALPLAAWIYIGLGVPWALALLPRSDWRQWPLVGALAFAIGPALLTAWMLIPGVIGGMSEQAYLRFDLIFSGTVLLAILGAGLAWRKRHTGKSQTAATPALKWDEWLLIALIVAAVVVRAIVIAYWPFTTYDALWVYGYQGRLYTLLGYIPNEIGYYPQFLSLQYTFMQLTDGAFNDSAARAVLPFLHIGSILAAYSLGSRLFTRRVGLFTAAIWALYPHVARWAQMGDLEIPLTFLLTLTLTFFVSAWMARERRSRRRDALLAGIVFGIAMWTKPTAGAFILGVVLVVALDLVWQGFDWRRWWPRFEVALLTGLACIPLGALWYARNALLGLPVLVFPNESWPLLATRSTDLLSWPLLALLLLTAYLASTRRLRRGRLFMLIGVLLILVGALPGSPLIDSARRDAPQSYIALHEAAALLIGLLLVIAHLWQYRRYAVLRPLSVIGWTSLLILPYFVTWFWSYSYHARLSFAIVPALILPSAFIIAHWTQPQKRLIVRAGWALLLIAAALPGIMIPAFFSGRSADYLWSNSLPDDDSKYLATNPGVFSTALFLAGHENATGSPPVVVAPGEQRLPFFLPHATIISDTVPTTFAELDGATHYVYGTQARWRYRDEGIDPLHNQLVASLGRRDIWRKDHDFETGTFEYELYAANLDQRFRLPERGPSGHLLEDEVIFGGAIRYAGDSLSNDQLLGNRVFMAVLWDVIAPPAGDYHVRLELIGIEDDQLYWSWQAPIAPAEDGLYYNTEVWDVGEYVVDERSFLIEDFSAIPMGARRYNLRVTLVDTATGERVPATINGEPVAGYTIHVPFSVGQ